MLTAQSLVDENTQKIDVSGGGSCLHATKIADHSLRLISVGRKPT